VTREIGRTPIRWLLALYAGSLVVGLALVGAVSWQGVETARLVDLNRTTAIVQAILDEQLESLASKAVDYAWWDSTQAHMLPVPDIDWAENNIGQYARDNLAITATIVLSERGETVYVSGEHVVEPATAEELLGPGLDQLVEDAQASSVEQLVAATGFILLHGHPALVAAAAITPEYPTEAQLAGMERGTLIYLRQLDRAWLERFRPLDLMGLAVVPEQTDSAKVALPSIGGGKPIGYIAWDISPSFGQVVSPILLPLAGGGALLFAMTVLFSLYVVQVNRNLAMAAMKQREEFRTRTDLFHMISHDLRTPLNAIVGYSELLVDQLGEKGAGKAAAYASNIGHAAQHLVQVINQVLHFGRIDAGQLDLNRQSNDISKVVAHAESLLAPAARERGVRLERVVSMPDPARLLFDSNAVEQVLVNLLSNAVKYSPDGGTVTIQVTQNSADELAVSVADGGIGISKENQSSLFSPFAQVHSGRDQKSGTGLGLAICKALIERHGGRIGVDSEPGRGATFWFTLPLERVPA